VILAGAREQVGCVLLNCGGGDDEQEGVEDIVIWQIQPRVRQYQK
jgi:hypothetical protein